MYIVRSKIRKLAKEHGKRVSKGYFEYLERRVHSIMLRHMDNLGSKATLNIEDAEALDAFRMTSS